jgi:hypothetical protein
MKPLSIASMSTIRGGDDCTTLAAGAYAAALLGQIEISAGLLAVWVLSGCRS